MARTADDLLAALLPERRQLMRNTFVRLTEFGDDSVATRRRVRTDELVPDGVSSEVVDTLLKRLADARLLTLGEGTAEVAHEVLIREWPTLRRWLQEDRDGIRLHRQLGDAARMWEAGGREPSDLYRGPRLVAATDWVGAHQPELNASERQLRRCQRRTRRTASAALNSRANRRLRALLAGAVALLLVAILAGVVALIQRHNAQAQALTSDAERLGAQAQTESQLDRALLLAVAGVKLENRPETRSYLLAALQRSPALIRMLRPSQTQVDGLQFTPDGRLIALGDAAGVVRFYDPSSWQPQGSAVRLPAPVDPLATSFSPDGRTLIVMTSTRVRSELYAIDIATRRARRLRTWRGLFPPPPNFSAGVAYSPDAGKVAVSLTEESPVATQPSAERLLMLDATTGRTLWQRQYPLHPGHSAPSVHFTPSGVLITSAQQGDTILWNANSGRILRRFPIGGFAALSRDGRRVALAVDSPSPANPFSHVSVLDLRSGRRRTLRADLPSEWIRTIAFTPDGSRVVAGTSDSVHVWDVGSGAISETYNANLGRREVMTLDPRGASVIVGAQDGSVAVFDLSGMRRLGRFFTWNRPDMSCGYSPCATVNRRSELMATDQGDGTTAIINLHTLQVVRTLPAHDGTLTNALAFLPDGRTLVTGGDRGLVTFWDVSTGRIIRTLRFAAPVWWAAASPDAKLLAVQTQSNNSPDNRVEVVRIATGEVLQSTPSGTATAAWSSATMVASLSPWAAAPPPRCSPAGTPGPGQQLFRRTANPQATAFALTPDSRLIGVGTADGHVLLLNARSGEAVGAPIAVAAGLIDEIAFSPDGTTFAVGSTDGTASLWDLRSHQRLGDPFPPYPGSVPAVVFEPNGRLLIIPLANAFEWPTDVRAWERFACQVAGRNLTRTEWHDALPNRPYQAVCPTNG